MPPAGHTSRDTLLSINFTPITPAVQLPLPKIVSFPMLPQASWIKSKLNIFLDLPFVCKHCAFLPTKKTTKRQKFYIFGRSSTQRGVGLWLFIRLQWSFPWLGGIWNLTVCGTWLEQRLNIYMFLSKWNGRRKPPGRTCYPFYVCCLQN